VKKWLPGARVFIKIAILAATIVAVAMFPGQVQIKWLGHDIQMPVAVLVAAILFMCGLIIFLHYIWVYLKAVPLHVRQFLQERRKQRGEKLLMEGLTAIAAQQPEEATQSIQFATNLIPDNPLITFIAAQAAHLSKDHAKAQEYFYEMTKNPRLSFLGYRGLIIQAQEQSDWLKAQALLEEAFKLRPDSPWVIQEMTRNALFLSQSRIISELKSLPVYRYLPKEHWHRHEALMLFLQSRHYQENTQIYEELLVRSHKLDPSLMTATMFLAECFINKQEYNAAQRVIAQSYKVFPHRDLVHLWLQLKPGVNALRQYQHAQKLTRHQPDHAESHWVLAELAEKANLWGEARSHLECTLRDGDRDDACRLMARVERAENPLNNDLIDHWMKRSEAIRHFSWVCQSCQHIHNQWQVFCSFCQSIDQIQWAIANHEEVLNLPKPA
jgi:HemY protein